MACRFFRFKADDFGKTIFAAAFSDMKLPHET